MRFHARPQQPGVRLSEVASPQPSAYYHYAGATPRISGSPLEESRAMVDSTTPPVGDAQDTAWYANALDHAAGTDSWYAMSTSLREQFEYHVYQEVPR
jgi:hypothetical protein